jgi:hypothetical protein
MSNLAYTYQNIKQLGDAGKLQFEIYEIRRKLLGDDHPDTLTAMANLAQTLGMIQEAENLE